MGHREGVPTWNESGNTGGSYVDMPMSLTDPEYNALYAIAGDSEWPVPLPRTTADMPTTPYTACLGDFSAANTYTNNTDAVQYIVVVVDPRAQFPARTYWMEEDSKFRQYTDLTEGHTGVLSSGNVSFVQIDPRQMVQGPILTRETWNSLMPRYQQVMGGHVNVHMSVPWDSTVDVACFDPHVAPSICGNKMPSVEANVRFNKENYLLYTDNGSWTNTTLYLPQSAVLGSKTEAHGDLKGKVSVLYSDPKDLFPLGTKKTKMVGAGDSSSLDVDWRIIPNNDAWCECPVYNGDEVIVTTGTLQPTPFAGQPFIIIKLPPKQVINIDLTGWVSYNVSVDVRSGSGPILVQDCPLTYPHSSFVNNIPSTVGMSFKGQDHSGREVSRKFFGAPIQLSPTSNGHQTSGAAVVAQLPGSNTSVASSIFNKFLPHVKSIVGTVGSAAKGFVGNAASKAIGGAIEAGKKMLPSLLTAAVRNIGAGAVRAAPLLLL